MQEWVGLHHGELRTRRVRVPRTVLIADLCCVSGHRCPGLGSMAWIPSVGLERGEVMLTTEYHRYDENPRESTRWLRYLYGHISHTVLGCIRYPGDSRGVRYGSKGICRQQIRQKKRRMMKDHTFWERGKAQSEMERYRKHGMLPGLQLFPEDWWLTSSHDALWSVWVPAGYNLRADQSYKKSHILPSYTVYTVCTQCVHSVYTVCTQCTRCTQCVHSVLPCSSQETFWWRDRHPSCERLEDT